MDSLHANWLLLAAEHQDFAAQRLAAEDCLAQSIAELNIPCMHHQACLAKKPPLLAIPGLTSGLVRMCHCMRSPAFLRRYEEFIGTVSIDRRMVAVLPTSVTSWMEFQRNSTFFVQLMHVFEIDL